MSGGQILTLVNGHIHHSPLLLKSNKSIRGTITNISRHRNFSIFGICPGCSPGRIEAYQYHVQNGWRGVPLGFYDQPPRAFVAALSRIAVSILHNNIRLLSLLPLSLYRFQVEIPFYLKAVFTILAIRVSWDVCSEP